MAVSRFEIAARYARHRFQTLHPFEVQAVLLNACNLRCSYCNCPELSSATLSTEQWIEIIEKLRSVGTMRIKWQGGEPTLRPDFSKLCADGAGARHRLRRRDQWHRDRTKTGNPRAPRRSGGQSRRGHAGAARPAPRPGYARACSDGDRRSPCTWTPRLREYGGHERYRRRSRGDARVLRGARHRHERPTRDVLALVSGRNGGAPRALGRRRARARAPACRRGGVRARG